MSILTWRCFYFTITRSLSQMIQHILYEFSTISFRNALFFVIFILFYFVIIIIFITFFGCYLLGWLVYQPACVHDTTSLIFYELPSSNRNSWIWIPFAFIILLFVLHIRTQLQPTVQTWHNEASGKSIE